MLNYQRSSVARRSERFELSHTVYFFFGPRFTREDAPCDSLSHAEYISLPIFIGSVSVICTGYFIVHLLSPVLDVSDEMK